MKFSTQIISIIIGTMLGLTIAHGCATTQEPSAQSEYSIKQCAAICTTVAASHCWGSRGVEQLIGTGLDALNCYEKCQSKAQFALGIDFECLRTATACEALDKCIDSGYRKISTLQPARPYSSPASPGRLSL